MDRDWEQRLASRTIAVSVAAGELIEVMDPTTGEIYYAPACRYPAEQAAAPCTTSGQELPEGSLRAVRGKHAAPRPTGRLRAGTVASFVAGLIAIPSLAAATNNWLSKPSVTNTRVEVESDHEAEDARLVEPTRKPVTRRPKNMPEATLEVGPEPEFEPEPELLEDDEAWDAWTRPKRDVGHGGVAEGNAPESGKPLRAEEIPGQWRVDVPARVIEGVAADLLSSVR